MSIRLLVVDGGGVLCSGIPRIMLEALATRYPPDIATKIRGLNTGNYASWKKIKENPDVTEEMYIKELFEGVELKESIQDIGLLLREHFFVYEDVHEVLRKVKEKGVELGIISNHVTVWFDHLIQKANLLLIFPQELIVVSQAVRCSKPGREILEIFYERATKCVAGLKKEEVLFVDDKQENVDAAIQYGFKAFRFDREKDVGTGLEELLKQHGVL